MTVTTEIRDPKPWARTTSLILVNPRATSNNNKMIVVAVRHGVFRGPITLPQTREAFPRRCKKALWWPRGWGDGGPGPPAPFLPWQVDTKSCFFTPSYYPPQHALGIWIQVWTRFIFSLQNKFCSPHENKALQFKGLFGREAIARLRQAASSPASCLALFTVFPTDLRSFFPIKNIRFLRAGTLL